MLCLELGLKPELVPVDMEQGEHKSPKFLALNPAHAVPVLDDDGFLLPESHAIMRYLCALSRDGRLYPDDIKTRAAIDRWLDWTHVSLNPPVQALAIQIMFAGENRDDSIVEASRSSIRAELAVLEAALESTSGVNGKTSLADLAVASTLALYEMCGGTFDDTARVRTYYEKKLKTIKSFAATAPPKGASA